MVDMATVRAVTEERLKHAIDARHRYEVSRRVADTRSRPADYALAMDDAVKYVQIVDGIVAYLVTTLVDGTIIKQVERTDAEG